MSTPSDLYKSHSAGPFQLCREQLQAIHDYNKRLKSEVRPGFPLLAQGSTPFLDRVPPNLNPGRVHTAETQWNSRNKRDGETTRAPCEDQEDNRPGVENSHEQWGRELRPANMEPKAQKSGNSLCIDPSFHNAGTTAIQHHYNQILAMNAFLYLQEQQGRLQQETSANAMSRKQIHGEQQQQPQLVAFARPKSPMSVKNSISSDDAAKSSLTTMPVDQSTAFTSELSTSLNTPTEDIRAEIPQHQKLEDHNAFQVHPPTVSFLPQTDIGYGNPRIHFPTLTYIVHGTTNDSDRQQNDSASKHNQSQSREITHFTPIGTPGLLPSADDDSKTSPQILTHSPEQAPLHTLKHIKKGTQPKKPHVPTRRWSRTYLNQLMREQQPRNLPEGITLTDHVDVQDVPIQNLTPAYCLVKAENNGDIIQFGAGTRIEEPVGDSRGCVEAAHGGILNSNEIQRVAKWTPFRLVIRDQEGNVKVDMSWNLNVAHQ